MLTFATSIEDSIGILGRVIRQAKEINDIQIRKEPIKFSLIIDSMILYMKIPKDSIKIVRTNK